MKQYQIACLPGDGPGPELLGGVVRALECLQGGRRNSDGGFAFDFHFHPMGLSAMERHGESLPSESLAAIRASDAALLGMIDKRAEHTKSAIGPMRRDLSLFADVRPIKPLGSMWALKSDIDLVCIRESTEGFLADRNMFRGCGEMMPTEDMVLSMRVLTRKACTRLAVFAFEYARRHGRRKITVVHKANVLRMGCGFFLDIVRETGKNYSDITLEDDYVDNVAHQLIAAPESYDILLMTNLMGDIISDEASALVSGMTGSANIGDDAAVFFPVSHLVDVDAGLKTVNPVPLFLCAALMLGHLGLAREARAFEEGVTAAAGRVPAGDGGRFPDAAAFIEEICGYLS